MLEFFSRDVLAFADLADFSTEVRQSCEAVRQGGTRHVRRTTGVTVPGVPTEQRLRPRTTCRCTSSAPAPATRAATGPPRTPVSARRASARRPGGQRPPPTAAPTSARRTPCSGAQSPRGQPAKPASCSPTGTADRDRSSWCPGQTGQFFHGGVERNQTLRRILEPGPCTGKHG